MASVNEAGTRFNARFCILLMKDFSMLISI